MSVRNKSSHLNQSRHSSGLGVIEVQYMNQHGKQVASKSISGQAGHHLDVTNSKLGGLPIPKGYSLNHDQTTTVKFQPRSQKIVLLVRGKNVKKQVNVKILKRSQHGQSTSVVPIMINGRVGDDVRITPRKYVPKNYYIDPSDHDQVLHINSDMSLTPKQAHFIYDQRGTQPLTLGQITVHYQDSSSVGHDINTIHVHNYIGKPFAIKRYQRNVPIGTYFVGISQGAEKFTNHPQDVVILVKHFIKGTLVFKDLKGHVINHRPMLSHYPDSSIPYSTLKRYVPQGYRFVKFGHHHKVLHSGDVNVMYIKRQSSRSRPSSGVINNSRGKVVISYDYNDQLIDRLIKTGPVGQEFDLKRYIHSIPAGYRFDKVISGNNVKHFKRSSQMVYIKVTR